ncbi:MAG: L,D-transpeptidase family protein [Deltaproteobacteria bacterium]|nr:L,D-transpeptidase family protein [Deltaproteobacteria bacterium]
MFKENPPCRDIFFHYADLPAAGWWVNIFLIMWWLRFLIFVLIFGCVTNAQAAKSFTVPKQPETLFLQNTLSSKDVTTRIAELISQRDLMPPLTRETSPLLFHSDLDVLYSPRSYQPLWMDGWLLKPTTRILVEHLRSSGDHGLCADAYQLERIEGLVALHNNFALHGLGLAPDNRALLDLLLSQAFLLYATHLVEGQVDPNLTHVNWKTRRRKADLIKLMNYAIAHDRLEQVLQDLFPGHSEYKRLVQALKQYSDIVAKGGWPIIPEGETIEPETSDPRLPLLRKRLQISGDLEKYKNPSEPNETIKRRGVDLQDHQYDPKTIAAVKAFQGRHGLVVDGVVGPKTLAALNVPSAVRLRQIELNLERWRWLPKDLGQRSVRINIADFSLQVVENDRSVMTMPVIVGTPFRKTPVFSARMTYLEFAPHWTVPPTILREDKLPQIKADPNYLSRHKFRILRTQDGDLVEIDPDTVDWKDVTAENFPGILRMDPGPWNPLGRVKFMFPNGFNVYLHDTNEPQLFNQDIRSFSSGCIRIQRPIDLAQYLLEDRGEMVCEQILDLLDGNTPQTVHIKPIPVHIMYWTAWASPDGRVHFREDVYLRDLDLEVALAEPSYRVDKRLDGSF